MSTKYKSLTSIALSGLLVLSLAFTADAQRRGGNGGGGFSGRGGGSFGGGGRSSGSFGGGRSGGFSGAPRISQRPSFTPRSNGGSFTPRGNSGSFTPRSNGGFGNYSRRPNTFVPPGSHTPRGSYTPRNYSGQRYSGIPRGGYSPRYGSRVYRYNRPYYNYRGYYRPYNRFYGYNFYSRLYYPRLGFQINVLPYGYYNFWYGPYQYYYSDGFYYQYDNNQYTVVEPPVGAVIDQLPSGAKSIVIDGQQYYELNGVYYQPITKDDGSTGYQIAGKDGELNTGTDNGDDQSAFEMDDVVNNLPPDSRKIKIDGETLFVSPDGTYFQEERDSNNKKVYRVVGTAEDNPADQ